MNAEQVTDAATEFVAQRVFAAVDGVVAEVAQEVQAEVGIPVGRSGSRIIRSKPGEAPRAETRKYQRSWTHRTTLAGDSIKGAAGTDSKIAMFLKDGTSRMRPRPHAIKAAQRLQENGVSRIKEKL